MGVQELEHRFYVHVGVQEHRYYTWGYRSTDPIRGDTGAHILYVGIWEPVRSTGAEAQILYVNVQ